MTQKFIIEITKHKPSKDYTVNIYEGINIFTPVFKIKRPTRWNNCLKQIGLFLQAKRFINIFQKHKLETSNTIEDKLWLNSYT